MDKSEQKALELYQIRERLNKKCTGIFDPNLPRRQAFMQGYNQALADVWKDAEGEELPEIDKEVIALEHIDDDYKVVFAHRVDPDSVIMTTIDGERMALHPLRHGTAGWNIPNLLYWLDVDLPKKEKGMLWRQVK